jgi:hypothetical protein
MSTELNKTQWQQLDAVEASLFLHYSEVCSSVISEELLTEPGTLTLSGGSTLFGEPITDQSDTSLLT